MRYFCTYFDQNFFSRALALYNSLLRHCNNFSLFVLCLDKVSYENICNLSLPYVTAIPLEDLEKSNTDLLSVKNNRSMVEYYWTCGPAFILYILNKYINIDLIVYLDADMFFFSDPQPMYIEMVNYSIGIVEHKFAKKFEKRKKFGIYNVGLLVFRRDDFAMECLCWWRTKCIEWCYDVVDNMRYGDQKYLDTWPAIFKGVKIIVHKGINVAPWNISNYCITWRDNKVWIDGQQLICFHFHGLKEIRPWLFDTNLGRSGIRPSHVVRENIFKFYIKELISCNVFGGPIKSIRKVDQHLNGFFRFVKWVVNRCYGILSRSYLVVFYKK